MSHLSYALLIKCKITRKRKYDFFILRLPAESASIFALAIVIRSETNEKTDLEGLCPQNTISSLSHCIIPNETQITLHFFQGRISTMPEKRAY